MGGGQPSGSRGLNFSAFRLAAPARARPPLPQPRPPPPAGLRLRLRAELFVLYGGLDVPAFSYA